MNITYRKLTQEGVKVKLVDLRGQKVREQLLRKGNNQSTQMDVSDVDGGVYLLYFHDEGRREKEILYYKIIIKHQ